jgi:hypothetical protein
MASAANLPAWRMDGVGGEPAGGAWMASAANLPA